jgi:SAM-dependent methyltransferase
VSQVLAERVYPPPVYAAKDAASSFVKWCRDLARVRLKVALGMPVRMHADFADRRMLEDVILPFFGKESRFERVLFLGCDFYTAHYKRMFRGRQYSTLEIDPSKRVFGAKQHVTDSVTNLTKHFAPKSLDLIVMNGLIGWGLDDRGEVERAIEQCHECLADGGVLIVGWDDVPERRPCPLGDLKALASFTPYHFAPLDNSEVALPGELRHTFSFFVPARPELQVSEAVRDASRRLGASRGLRNIDARLGIAALIVNAIAEAMFGLSQLACIV